MTPVAVPGRKVFHSIPCFHVMGSIKMQGLISTTGLRECQVCQKGIQGKPASK